MGGFFGAGDAPKSVGKSVALVMIVRDEARCIERCLRSASPHVDRMLVLDTGSQDETAALARACGAEVHHMAWAGSFSIARNRALDLADADWNLVLDADEWIESGGEALRGSIPEAPALGVVRIDSLVSAAGETAVGIDWITRLLPRGVRYVGDVHEQPDAALPRSRLSLVLGHDGYQPQAMQSKKGRNRELLQAMLARCHHEDAYLLFQLGKDLEVYGELGSAADAYLRSLGAVSPTAIYRDTLTVRAMHCLGKSGRLPEALAMASSSLHDMGESVDYFFTLGDLCLDAAVANPMQATAEWLPMAESAWLRCLEIGEQPERSGSIAGRGSYLAAHNLFAIHQGMGRDLEAAQYQQLSERMRSATRIDLTEASEPTALCQ